MIWNGERLKIHSSRVSDSKFFADGDKLVPGEHLIIEERPAMMTGEGILIFDELQPAGKKSMPGKLFLQGARNWV